jgi:hypothetical protein
MAEQDGVEKELRLQLDEARRERDEWRDRALKAEARAQSLYRQTDEYRRREDHDL